MKKLLLLLSFFLSCLVGIISCGNNTGSKDNLDSEKDSILAKLQLIDSLRSSGTYYHHEGWLIGKIVDNGYKKYEILSDEHSVKVYVNKLSYMTDTLLYITLDYKDYSAYSSRFESKTIDFAELKSFYKAIDDIKKQYGKQSDHFELYLYRSKSEADLSLRHLINSESWDLSFCSIEIALEDLDELKNLLSQAEKKIIQIKGQGGK